MLILQFIWLQSNTNTQFGTHSVHMFTINIDCYVTNKKILENYCKLKKELN